MIIDSGTSTKGKPSNQTDRGNVYINGKRDFGPEQKISAKDQPKGAWKEQQAADYLGMKVSTLRNWRHLCKGPRYCKCGRSVVYLQADLDAFLEKVSVQPVA